MKMNNETPTKEKLWNKRLCVVMALAVAISPMLSQVAQACYVIIVPTINVTKVTVTTTDPVVCGTNCLDSASATVNCPGFGCNKSVVNGCPSKAECKAPRNPDGTRGAVATGFGNCHVPTRWTGWITQSGSGCTANAKASASKKVTVTNTTTTTVTFGWDVIWIPWHDYWWMCAFEDGADGNVMITHTVTDLTNGANIPLLDSTTQFHANSPDIFTDSTGWLTWIREPFLDHSTGDFYENAFRPFEIVEQPPILLNQYTVTLAPGESIDLQYDFSSESQMIESFPPQDPSPPPGPMNNQMMTATADGTVVGGPRIISKTVGQEGCLISPDGDLNGDCLVDWSDVAILSAGWLTVGLPL